MHKIIIM